MKKFLPEIAVAVALLITVGYGFGQTWTKTSAASYPISYIVESADGREILAIGSGAYLSTNSGASWNPVFNNYNACAGMSADGTKIIAGIATDPGSLIYISTNGGAGWTPTILPNTNWNVCASSADGRVLAAAVGNSFVPPTDDGSIYTSTNFGVNWRTNNLIKSWRSLTSSADGVRLAAAAYGDNVYLSTNSGLTWQATGASGSWRSVACSLDGKFLVATGDGGTAISTNGGSTWRTTAMSGQGVASSADGRRLVLVNNGITINTSTNYGLTWSSTNIYGMNFIAPSSSADGDKLFLGGNDNDGVWKWQATPAPKLSLASLSNNITLSWLIPSTNLAVEQSTDLVAGNWVALTNSPALNFTNLQNYLTMPATNGNLFYRLANP